MFQSFLSRIEYLDKYDEKAIQNCFDKCLMYLSHIFKTSKYENDKFEYTFYYYIQYIGNDLMLQYLKYIQEVEL